MSEIKVGRIVMGVCQTNCYFLYREGQEEVIVVDVPDKGRYLKETLQKNGFKVAGIFLTHGHFDHIWGAEELKAATQETADSVNDDGQSVVAEGSPVLTYALEAEREILTDDRKNLSAPMGGRPFVMEADVYVQDGQEITVAGMTCKVIATPGHTAGGCCYYFEEEGFLLSGDTLFQESVGRTDFPTGSMSTLVRSIKEKLFVLPDSTTVFPGHGDSTTIGNEKKYNPFLG